MPLEELVQEGMQQLMNSALVVVPLRGGDITNPRYRLTRAGRAGLESGDIAARIAQGRPDRLFRGVPHEGGPTPLWPKVARRFLAGVIAQRRIP